MYHCGQWHDDQRFQRDGDLCQPSDSFLWKITSRLCQDGVEHIKAVFHVAPLPELPHSIYMCWLGLTQFDLVWLSTSGICVFITSGLSGHVFNWWSACHSSMTFKSSACLLLHWALVVGSYLSSRIFHHNLAWYLLFLWRRFILRQNSHAFKLVMEMQINLSWFDLAWHKVLGLGDNSCKQL